MYMEPFVPPRAIVRISVCLYFFAFHLILLRKYHASTHFSPACVHLGQERTFLGLAYEPAFLLTRQPLHGKVLPCFHVVSGWRGSAEGAVY